MKNITKALILAVFLGGLAILANPALAATPILSATYQGGSSGSVQLSISDANAYSQINLYSRQTSSLWTVVNNIGQTDGNGNFTQVVSLPGDGSSNPLQIYVIVGGLQSSTVSVSPNGGCYGTNCGGCTYNCGISGSLTFSQNNPSMTVGQSLAVSIYSSSNSYYNGSFYISSNSNSNAVTASIAGSTINLYANNIGGSSSIIVCQSGNTSACGTLYVTVTGNCYSNCGSGNSLTFSQSTVSLTTGQTQSVTAYNYNGSSLYISSNSNSSVASASVSGNQINIYAISSGSSVISVCSNGSSSCGTIYVTVSGYGSGSLILSPSTLSLTSPQTASVTISGSNYGGGYYVSSNSNSSVAGASVSGNILYVDSLVGGSTTITVCQSGNSSQCATLYLTVNGNGCTYNCGSGTLSLSQTTLSLNYGQSATVSSYNASALYVSSNSDSGVVSVSASGNQAVFYGQSNGSSTVVLCATSSSQCASVYVTVGGGSCIYSNCSGTLTFSPSSVNLNLGQSSTVSIYNSYSSGSYYISSNSNSAIVSASITGGSLYLLAGSIGSTTITVCQTGVSSCGTLYVTVGGIGGSGTLSLSQSSLNLASGQTAAVTAYTGGSGIYVSSNSNSAVASYSTSGNTISVYGSGIGSTTLNICSNSNYGCAALYVTVGGSSSCTYSVCSGFYLSQTSLSLGSGQSSAITVYGNGSYYISSNSNSWVANATLAGNILNVYGSQTGSTNISICQNSPTQCATLYVTVGGNTGYYGTTNVVLSQSSLNLSVGQTTTVNASGNGGYGYFLSSNSNPSVVTASFNGSVLSLYGAQNGSSTLQVCQNSASSCASLYVTVGGGTAYNYNPNPGSGLQYPGTNVLGASTYANGQLIAEGSTVYIVYRNTQTGFSSGSVFRGLGFSFGNVVQVGNSGLTNSGYVISTAYAAHPWGSWIKSGSTVYFVQESGLIPIPNWATFLANGGQQNLIVPANSYDFQLPILSPMTNNDPRLN